MPGPGDTTAEPLIDPTVAHTARVYNYLLGGTTNFEPDREAAKLAAKAVGGFEVATTSVRSNRVFLAQAVRYLAGEAGVRQFLDIGTGIPSADNAHEVALEARPDARVVYVDNDPIVLAHAHQLLPNEAPGSTAFVLGDLFRTDDLLAKAGKTLDLSEPVAVLLIAVLHHYDEASGCYDVVSHIMDAMPAGSYLAMTHLTDDMQTDEMRALAASVPQSARYRFTSRTRDEFARFFEGLELVEPGLVPIDQWRPDQWTMTPEGRYHYGAVGRKP